MQKNFLVAPTKKISRRHAARTLLRTGIGIFFFTLLVGGLLWKNGTLPSWLRGKAIQLYLKHMAPLFPFEVESLDIQGSWSDFLAGKIPQLTLSIKKDQARAILKGPFQLKRDAFKKELSFQYTPQITLSILTEKTPQEPPSTPIKVSLNGKVSQNLQELREIHLEMKSGTFLWKQVGVQIDGFQLTSQWHFERPFELELQTGNIEWSSSPDQILHLGKTQLSSTYQSIFKYQASIQGGEILWNGLYLDLPLQRVPLTGEIRLQPQVRFLLQAGPNAPRKLNLEGELVEQNGKASHLKMSWKTTQWKVNELANAILTATQSTTVPALEGLKTLRKIQLRTGTFQTQGWLSTPLDSTSFSWSQIQTEGTLNLQNLSLRWPRKAFAIRNFNLSLPFSLQKATHGQVSLQDIYYRRIHAQLEPTSIHLNPQNLLTTGRATIQIGQNSKIPLRIDSIPVSLGELSGSLGTSQTALTTSLRLGYFNAETIKNLLCEEEMRVPPAAIGGNFPNIEITPSSIDLTGDIHAHLFGGVIDVDQIGFFDLDTDVPELDFNLDFRDIRLDLLGEWAGFGKMDGLLEGYVRDATFQSWLPTQYELSFDLKKYRKRKISFSPEAMKNFVKVFAGDDLSYLSGVAQWLAFGLPRRIFGGYDVDYAGISLLSREGVIILETHDPEETQKSHPEDHNLLSGPRIKMPLRLAKYPLVVDAIALSNYIRQMTQQLENLGQAQAERENQARRQRKEKKNEILKRCQPPEF